MPFYWDYILIIVAIAVFIDFKLGEFPGKHPIEYFGDFILWYQSNFYKNSVLAGAILTAIFSIGLTIGALILEHGLFYLFGFFKVLNFIPLLIIGLMSASLLASKCLKEYVERVINTDDPDKKRDFLSYLVTRETGDMDDSQVYTTLIETHSENLSDGVIAPLFYLCLFGLPGIVFYKAINTLDSMIGFKNERYNKFGKVAAIADDILNIIPSRITAFLIWNISKTKHSYKKVLLDAPKYSSSPNAGYPVSAAAYGTGVKVGGTVYYKNQKIEKGIIGPDDNVFPKRAAMEFVKIHTKVEELILSIIIILLAIRLYLAV